MTQALQPPHIRDIDRTDLPEKLALVGGFLAEHGLAGYFGVTLDHSHFPVGPDEALLEVTDETARTQFVSVVPRSDVSDNAVAIWGFGPDGQPIARQWCPSKHGGQGGYH